ncbi:phage tail domain-containing protein [Microtetraspora malaysiensis]|uniref:phage tail domain-containing protein n=1 Tax=Microtetraspora malaysiensis TaxID=161358 RepID=UPI003D8BEA75
MTVTAMAGRATAWPATTVEWTTPKDLASSSTAAPRYDFTEGTGGLIIMPGAKGFDAPDWLLHYEEMPAMDGAFLNNVRANSRELFLPLFMYADDRPTYMRMKRDFLASINPVYGPGKLTLTEGDGSSRFITAYYTGGAEGDEGEETSGFTWCKYGVILRAMDPYWYAGSSQVVEFTPGANDLKKFFGEPFFGLYLNSNQELNGDSAISVTGDVDTWPVWYLHGPGRDWTFTRKVNGGPDRTFRLNLSLGGDESVVIDTRPGSKSVTNQATGENLWGYLGPNPDLWPIAPGENRADISMDGAGAESAVTMVYTPRYLSA